MFLKIPAMEIIMESIIFFDVKEGCKEICEKNFFVDIFGI